jgi:hypothetical protein
VKRQIKHGCNSKSRFGGESHVESSCELNYLLGKLNARLIKSSIGKLSGLVKYVGRSTIYASSDAKEKKVREFRRYECVQLHRMH